MNWTFIVAEPEGGRHEASAPAARRHRDPDLGHQLRRHRGRPAGRAAARADRAAIRGQRPAAGLPRAPAHRPAAVRRRVRAGPRGVQVRHAVHGHGRRDAGRAGLARTATAGTVLPRAGGAGDRRAAVRYPGGRRGRRDLGRGAAGHRRCGSVRDGRLPAHRRRGRLLGGGERGGTGQRGDPAAVAAGLVEPGPAGTAAGVVSARRRSGQRRTRADPPDGTGAAGTGLRGLPVHPGRLRTVEPAHRAVLGQPGRPAPSGPSGASAGKPIAASAASGSPNQSVTSPSSPRKPKDRTSRPSRARDQRCNSPTR